MLLSNIARLEEGCLAESFSRESNRGCEISVHVSGTTGMHVMDLKVKGKAEENGACFMLVYVPVSD